MDVTVFPIKIENRIADTKEFREENLNHRTPMTLLVNITTNRRYDTMLEMYFINIYCWHFMLFNFKNALQNCLTIWRNEISNVLKKYITNKMTRLTYNLQYREDKQTSSLCYNIHLDIIGETSWYHYRNNQQDIRCIQ